MLGPENLTRNGEGIKKDTDTQTQTQAQKNWGQVGCADGGTTTGQKLSMSIIYSWTGLLYRAKQEGRVTYR